LGFGVWDLGFGILAILFGIWLGVTAASPDWGRATFVTGTAMLLLIIRLNPLLGLLTWLVVSPFGPYIGLSIELGAGIPNLSFVRIGGIVLTLLLLGQIAVGRRRLVPLRPSDAMILLFCGTFLLSTPRSVWGTSAAAQRVFDAFILPFAGYFIARQLVADRTALRRVVVAVGVISFYLAVLTIREQLTGEALFAVTPFTQYTKHLRRVIGLLANPAYIGFTLGMTLPFLIWQATHTRERLVRALLLAVIGLALVGDFLAYSRAGWLAALLVLFTMAPFYRGLRRVMAMALLGIVAFALINWQRILTSPVVTERLTAEAPILGRLQTLQIALDLWRSDWLFGIGYANFGPISIQRGYWPDLHHFWIPTPHNSFISIGAEAGLITLVPYVLIFVLMFAESVRLYRICRRRGLEPERLLMVGFWGLLLAYVAPTGTFDNSMTGFSNQFFAVAAGSMLGMVQQTLHRTEQTTEGC